VPEKRATVRGIELAYELVGAGDPFLWGHGMTSSRKAESRRGLLDMSPVATGACLVRYDARGHGESGWSTEPDDYTWENLARDMIGLADALGIERFRAGGASMGCATALFAALLEPARVERLVLVIPPTAWETRGGRAKFIEAGATFVEEHGLEALADLEDQEPLPELFEREFPEKREQDRLSTLEMDSDAFPVLMRGAALCDFPSKEAVRSIGQDTLILAWDTDPVHPVATAESLYELLPNATLQIARSLAKIRRWPSRVAEFLAGP